MSIILVGLGYLKWHYGKAIISLSRVWRNFLYFIVGFFSLGLLFRNFFDPWKRMADRYPKGFSLKEYTFTFLVNLIVRIVGMLLRTVLIIVALINYTFLALLYPVALIVWIILPLIIIYLIGTGLLLMFSR